MRYSCPMHPQIVQDHPGNCPICGMSLEAPLQKDDSEYEEMLIRFVVCGFLSLPVLFWGMLNQSPYLQFLFTTPVVLWGAWPFWVRAWESLRNRSPNMFTLIALGVGAAYLYSTLALFFPQLFPVEFKEGDKLHLYFESAAVITTLVLLGQVLELKARQRTSHAIDTLLQETPQTAHRLVDGTEEAIPTAHIHPGDLLRIKPGEKIPVDGIVVEGFSMVDEAMITGEAEPIRKEIGSKVTGGTLNQTGSFIMRAEKVGQETLLAQIVNLVAEAQRTQAPIQQIADKVSAYFVPAVIAIALLTFFAWALWGPQPSYTYGLINAIAVLIIACPCALGLATPMSLMVGLGKGAKQGILIKNGTALETLEKVEVVALDKTGTITEGKPTVTHVEPNDKQGEILLLAAAVEQGSEHPLAQAILKAASDKQLKVPQVTDFKALPGIGVEGRVENHTVFVGNGLQVVVDGKLLGTLQVEDPIKASSYQAVDELHVLGLKLILLTGDKQAKADHIAQKLHFDEVYAEIKPEQKYQLIKGLKEKGLKVAMAGDGINDSPALAEADVGIAMGTGTGVAIESAAITLLKGDLQGIAKAIRLSRATMANIRQNLWFAFLYNALGIPLAAGILYPTFGLLLSPMIASAAMALSSVSVILNALRLNQTTLK